MILDIMACIPFGLFSDDSDQANSGGDESEYKNLLRLIRLPRLYRLVRISRFFKIFKMNRYSPTFMKIQDFFRLNHSFTRLMSVFVSVIIFAHILACFWFFIAKLEGFGPDSWVVKTENIDEQPGT
jgi:hyperpolarization activated cyclic nucleotide-gated potassium channel 2